MSEELIAILAAGVALGGVLLASLRGISDQVGRIEERWAASRSRWCG